MMSTRAMSEDALIRLENLRRLKIAPAELSSRVGGRNTYWHDLLAGNKSFGEKAARKIEAALDLPRLSLDTPAGQSNTLPGLPAAPLYTEGSNHALAPVQQAPVATNGVALLGQTLNQLNALLDGIDSGTRETIASLTQEAICKPDKAQANIAAIEALVRFATGKIETAQAIGSVKI